MAPIYGHQVRVIHEPYRGAPPPRKGDPAPTDFTATWSATVDLLQREAGNLGAQEVVLVVHTAPGNVSRRDGGIRADAKVLSDYVEVYLPASDVGPIRWTCDRFTNRGYRGYLPGWQSNVRAIALGMEALRKVDRYGIAGDGQQYRGWQAIGTGAPIALGAQMTVDQAARTLADAAGLAQEAAAALIDNPEAVTVAYRRAARTLHPDRGGDPEAFRLVTQARDLLTNQ